MARPVGSKGVDTTPLVCVAATLRGSNTIVPSHLERPPLQKWWLVRPMLRAKGGTQLPATPLPTFCNGSWSFQLPPPYLLSTMACLDRRWGGAALEADPPIPLAWGHKDLAALSPSPFEVKGGVELRKLPPPSIFLNGGIQPTLAET